jgi:hypothetical protein
MCPHTTIFTTHTAMYVSSYTICVRILLYMCSHILKQSGLARDASPRAADTIYLLLTRFTCIQSGLARGASSRAAVDALLAADTLYLLLTCFTCMQSGFARDASPKYSRPNSGILSLSRGRAGSCTTNFTTASFTTSFTELRLILASFR